MVKRLENKTAVITGGTTGIGFEIAKSYIEEGASVLITGRTQKKVDQSVSELGKKATGLAADAVKLSDLDRLASKAKSIFGLVDILIANAGIGIFAPLSEIDEASYDQLFDLNVKGVFFTVQKILPLMKKGGAIILTSSCVHDKGVPTGSIYATSKAAVRAFSRNMAAELGEKGIRVNSLSPGLIPTQFFKNSNLGEVSYADFEKLAVEQAPLRRPGTPREIANAAIFLGSDESSYVTGADLVIDGGWSNV